MNFRTKYNKLKRSKQIVTALIKFKSIFGHKGLEKLAREISCSKRRMSISSIIASIIVSSSLIMQMNIGPIIFGYPIQGIIGYIIAIFLGFVLIIILKSGKWK